MSVFQVRSFSLWVWLPLFVCFVQIAAAQTAQPRLAPAAPTTPAALSGSPAISRSISLTPTEEVNAWREAAKSASELIAEIAPIVPIPTTPPALVQEPFTALPDAIRRAAVQGAAINPSVQGAMADRSAAQALFEGSEYAWYPSVQANASVGQSSNRGINLIFDQPLYDWGRRAAERKSLDLRVQSNDANVLDVTQEAAIRSARVMVALARNEAQVQVAQANLRLHEMFLANIVRRAQAGINTVADVSLAQTRLSQVQAALLEQQDSLELLRRQYSIILRAEPPKLVSSSARSTSTQVTSTQAGSASTMTYAHWPEPPALPWRGALLVEQTEAVSPKIISQKLQAQSLLTDAQALESSLYPQLSFRSQKAFNGSASKPVSGLNLSWQGDVALSSASRVIAAKERARAAELSIDATRQQIAEQVASAESNLSSSLARKRSAAVQLEFAKRTTEQFQTQFTLGRRTWSEVMNTLSDINGANARIADAHYQSWDGWVQLVGLAGQLLPR